MMSDSLRAVILGIIEGVTEFLPVSSTGHCCWRKRFFDLGEGRFWNSFAVLIQLGAILAILRSISSNCGGSRSACSPIPTTVASSSASWWRFCPRS